MITLLQKIKYFLHAEIVLCVAAAAAILTMFFVPPSSSYISYLDLRVLSLLFCLMAVVSGFQKTGIFLKLSELLLKRVKTLRALCFVLIMLCFFTSMLITNDVALITFVPFTVMLLTMTQQQKYMIRIIVLQTIAANLGSMLTPIGNPQNLYLFSRYEVSIMDFIKITYPYVIVSFLLLFIILFLTQKERLTINLPLNNNFSQKQYGLLSIYTFLFLVCIGCVLRLYDYRIMLIIVIMLILLFDIRILKRVDYTLLLTFVCFFLFVGNIGNITIFKDFLAALLTGKELPVAIATSQIISNVPAAVLLSAFAKDYKALILGTDIGGLGTLVASLASLISYKFYCRTEKAQKGLYLRVFILYNILFLTALCLFYYWH